MTSSYEGFGNGLLEAYASGKPVVSFDIEKGPKEIMIDGETGLKARPFDVEDYADKLASLMASEPLRKAMGENGRRFLMRTYQLERVGRELENAIIATSGLARHTITRRATTRTQPELRDSFAPPAERGHRWTA